MGLYESLDQRANVKWSTVPWTGTSAARIASQIQQQWYNLNAFFWNEAYSYTPYSVLRSNCGNGKVAIRRGPISDLVGKTLSMCHLSRNECRYKTLLDA